jgi:pimeloyl-ACP methyl ester carboxylesterase
VEFDIDARFGRIHASQHGSPDRPLVLGVHGLAGTHDQLGVIGSRVGDSGFRFVAVDLRGRGASDRTPAGTYGWANHALDLLAVADALSAARFAVVGVSMGGSIAMKTAEVAGQRLSAIVLVDVAGRVDAGVGEVVAEAIAAADPAVADPTAVAEDRAYTMTQDPYDRWQKLTMPTLLVRATRQIRRGAGYFIPADDRDRFAATVPSSTVVEVDATHLTIADHDATAAAITEFLTSHAT